MFRYFTVIKSSDGLPLLTRNFPVTKQLPFALTGTLNAIFTFADGYGVKLLSVDTENYKIVWKMYQANVTLILIESDSGVDENIYFNKIDLLFDAMVLLHGLDDLINIKNVEKFQREIRIAYPMLDNILNGNKYQLLGDVTNAIDVLITNEKSTFQNTLNAITPIVNTHYSCLLLNGKIIVASKSWWELKPREVFLLSLLCMTSKTATCRDIPVYLPHKNPHTPLRLLTYNLVSDDVVLCFICSEQPSIDAVEEDIIRIWDPIYKQLVNLKLQSSRSVPATISLDPNMITFLLINKKKDHAITSLDPDSKSMSQKKERSIEVRYELLKMFYQNIMPVYFNDSLLSKDYMNGSTSDINREDTVANEAYILLGNYKCYALNRPTYEFYAIYDEKIPTYAIRGVTQECLSALIKDSQI